MTDLFDFPSINGTGQEGPLALFNHTLYGMLYYGGTNLSGIIYSLHTDGSGYTVLMNCNSYGNAQAGDYPSGELVLNNNIFYGTMSDGGTYADGGVIFSIEAYGNNDTVLYNFHGINGENPIGNLTISRNAIYGAASGGGIYGYGVIFKYDLPAPTSTIPNIFVPNAFSPNGDGQNDILLAKGVNIKDFYMAIYDRWGEKVFETQNINKGWDGRYNGQPENVGSYIYFATGSYYDGNTFEKKGSVALIR